MFFALGFSLAAVCEDAHIAIVDAIWLAFIEVLPDGNQEPELGFLLQTVTLVS